MTDVCAVNSVSGNELFKLFEPYQKSYVQAKLPTFSLEIRVDLFTESSHLY